MATARASTLYNDNDRHVCDWLRNLIDAGYLPDGDVDERSILDLEPDDCRPVTHFFAGIGGWPLALSWAGWTGPVWTASCPCQPFSTAGKRKGTDDERHLWPALFRLIAERRPPVVFGEQVASRDGREWLAGVRADLEGVGYAVGAADLPAASVGAPHRRQRLWWVADANEARREGRNGPSESGTPTRKRSRQINPGGDGGLGDTERDGGRREVQERGSEGGAADRRTGEVRDRLGDTDEHGPQGRGLDAGEHARQRPAWSSESHVLCREPGREVLRRVEPGTFPLADGVPGRVGRLRAYGNAIVPQVAARFVMAYMEAVS